MTVLVLTRPEGVKPGDLALRTLTESELAPDGLYCFAVGESSLATGARRHLVNEVGVQKTHVTFCGFYRLGHS